MVGRRAGPDRACLLGAVLDLERVRARGTLVACARRHSGGLRYVRLPALDGRRGERARVRRTPEMVRVAYHRGALEARRLMGERPGALDREPMDRDPAPALDRRLGRGAGVRDRALAVTRC